MVLIPAEHRGRGGSPVRGRGCIFFGGGGGGPGFNRDVKHDKDWSDRLGEWSCRDRAAIFSIPYTALSTVVTPSAPLFLIHAPHSCCINLFLLLVINAAGQFDVSKLDVCQGTDRNLPIRAEKGI